MPIYDDAMLYRAQPQMNDEFMNNSRYRLGQGHQAYYPHAF